MGYAKEPLSVSSREAALCLATFPRKSIVWKRVCINQYYAAIEQRRFFHYRRSSQL